MFAFVQKNNYIKYNASNTAFYLCNKTRKKKRAREKVMWGEGEILLTGELCKTLINSLFFFNEIMMSSPQSELNVLKPVQIPKLF